MQIVFSKFGGANTDGGPIIEFHADGLRRTFDEEKTSLNACGVQPRVPRLGARRGGRDWRRCRLVGSTIGSRRWPGNSSRLEVYRLGNPQSRLSSSQFRRDHLSAVWFFSSEETEDVGIDFGQGTVLFKGKVLKFPRPRWVYFNALSQEQEL